MSGEQNKEIVRKAFRTIVDGDPRALENITAENWVNHDPALPPMRGKDGARQLVNLFHGAFPDAQLTTDHLIGEGDRVGGHFTFTGTHTGPFLDIPATGKKVKVEGSGIFRVVDGKLTDNWVNIDAFGMMQQLGLAPAMGKSM